MCRVFQASCRVCLTENISPPYIYLLDDESLSDSISNALHLQTRLFDATLYPNHICETCKNIIEPFLELQNVALTHEKIILRYQEKIKHFGLEFIKASLSDEFSNRNEKQPHLENAHVIDRQMSKDTDQIKELSTYHSTDEKSFTSIVNNSIVEISQDDEVECQICGPSKVFKRSSLQSHLKTFHKEKDIECEVAECSKKFKKYSDMKKHVKNIHKGEVTLCTHCGENFKDINYHIKVVHENISYPCDTCTKKYTTKQGLNFHKKYSHGDAKKEVCDYCAVEVKHLKHHIKMMHSGIVEKRISCQEVSCEKKFRTKQESTIHYNAAHLNKKEMCPLCGGWYKNLYTHIHQTHQSEKKHICEQVHDQGLILFF